MATDPFATYATGPNTSAISLVAITPNDSADFANVVRMIYVGNRYQKPCHPAGNGCSRGMDAA